MDNYVQILFGTALGFVLTMLLQMLDWLKKRRRANRLLMIEYPEIGRFLDGVVNISKRQKMILTTEIPNLKMVSQVDELLSLSRKRRQLIYVLTTRLTSAENLRQLAVPLLNAKGSETQLEIYGQLCNDTLKAAHETIEQLRTEMK